MGWNRFETNLSAASDQRRTTHSLYSLDHPLNICLRRLCQSNENTTLADHWCHKQHALTLIQQGANVYAMYDQDSSYPFLLAVQTGDKSIVEMILRQAHGYLQWHVIEPLICACTKSFYEIVQILVDAGFNPNTIMDNRGTSTVPDRKRTILISNSNHSFNHSSARQFI